MASRLKLLNHPAKSPQPRGRHHKNARKTTQMSDKVFRFTATTVDCSEAIDWEIVQVCFDTEPSDFDETNRTSPYLMISANFEFSGDVQLEFHDGSEYGGDSLGRIDLWRNRALVRSRRNIEFDIDFELSDDAFAELREYLKILQRSDCFRGYPS